MAGTPRLFLSIALVFTLGATAAAAEQVVIVSEARTSPDAVFGGRLRIVQRIEGRACREEVAKYLSVAMTWDSTGAPRRHPPGGSSTPDMEQVSVWFPEEGIWRTWSVKGEKEYSETAAAELKAQFETGDRSLSEIQSMFGANANVVSEFGITVDSSGAETTLLGQRTRPYVFRGILRFAELEADIADSIRILRRVWLTPGIPGAEQAPGITPAKLSEGVIASMQFFILPMLGEGMTRLDQEVAKFAGRALKDETWMERASEPPVASGTPPDTTKSMLVFTREIVEIRREPGDPGTFRIPAGYVRRPTPDSGTGR